MVDIIGETEEEVVGIKLIMLVGGGGILIGKLMKDGSATQVYGIRVEPVGPKPQPGQPPNQNQKLNVSLAPPMLPVSNNPIERIRADAIACWTDPDYVVVQQYVAVSTGVEVVPSMAQANAVGAAEQERTRRLKREDVDRYN